MMAATHNTFGVGIEGAGKKCEWQHHQHQQKERSSIRFCFVESSFDRAKCY